MNFLIIIFFVALTASHFANAERPELVLEPLIQKPYIKSEQLETGLTLHTVSQEGVEQSYLLVSTLLSEEDALFLKTNLESIIQEAEPELHITLKDEGNYGSYVFDVGFKVVIEEFPDKASALDFKNKHGIISSNFSVVDTSFSAQRKSNQSISILELKPHVFKGAIKAQLANGNILGTKLVSKTAIANSAIAAVNGGYFSYDESLGVIGDPAGVSVIDGILASEPVAHRPALLVRNNPSLSLKILTNMTSKLYLETGGSNITVDGVNRLPGKVFNCGFYRHDELIPAFHDTVCENTDEIIVYNALFGDLKSVINNEAFFVHLNSDGEVLNKSDLLPASLSSQETLVLATGDKKQILRKLIANDHPIIFKADLFNNGEQLALTKGTYVINGGPSLLKGGNIPLQLWESEGWSPNPLSFGVLAEHEKDKLAGQMRHNNVRKAFFDSWVSSRHPRTGVGIRADGTAFIVVVYGRDYKDAAGASVYELAKLFSALGVQEAINLDGGGSSVMVARGQLTGSPSDESGERPVGDALLFLPSERE